MMKVVPIVIAPTYNNAATLPEVVARVVGMGLAVLVVNDGSTDRTGEALTALGQTYKEPQLRVITHRENRGKAAALMTGFAEATRIGGYTHAVTIDTDGQLEPEEARRLLATAETHPRGLILGVRDLSTPDYPAKNKTGRWFSNLAIRLECGARVTDSQCGFRVYPLELIRVAGCKTGHFSFEAEVLTRAAWAGYEIVEERVSCKYLPREKRVSHFKPWRDSFRGLGLHGGLLIESLYRRPMAALARREREPKMKTGRVGA